MSSVTSLSRVLLGASICGVLVFGGLGAGCKSGDFVNEATSVVSGCPVLSGTPWVPNVASLSESNHDSQTTISEAVLTGSGPLTGLGQGAPASREVEVTFTISEDLGPSGSVTLSADVTNFPSALTGSAYPLLVYLSDGTSEFVNLARGSGACGTQGFFTCDSGGACATNASCSVAWPSAFSDRAKWEQRQFAVFGYTSINTFPTCNWAGGTDVAASNPACAFNTHFFDGSGRLRTGTYKARYVLLADRYKTLTGHNAGLRVTVTQKKDPNGAGGAIDLNVVLVGSANVQAGRTEQGKRNLDTLVSMVNSHFDTAGLGVKVGVVRVYEWGCESGGDPYSNVDVNNLGTMFSAGSARLTGAGTRSLNVFLVNAITWSGDGTILGVAGGIGGPIKAGIPTSGLAFTSFGKLGSFNPSCSSTPCPASDWEHEFAEMGLTISHEIGHYLGLNHPSESGGSDHDVLDDTPLCTKTDTVGGKSRLTISSCMTDTNVLPATGKKCSESCIGYNKDAGVFCPEALECQFNHMMWWSSKNFKNGVGDGNAFSEHSAGIINYNPLVQ